MATFFQIARISVSLTCTLLILLLACGARAVIFSTKPPRPFRQLCKVILVTDILLMIISGIQPWINTDVNFDHEYTGTCSLLVTMATTLLSLERMFALKCPLKYIRCTGYDKFTARFVASIYGTMILLYLFVRFPVCYMIRYTLDTHECMLFQVYSILSVLALLICTATACFAFVCHATATNKRQHTRRITAMGLPQNHALSATDTHVSATLFALYPFMICIGVFSVLLIYWPFIKDETVSLWLSVATRIVHCAVHGVLFNFWFDEWRLHILTVLSPLSGYLQDWADVMRINVYNIVVAEAFGSRLHVEGSIKSYRISRSRSSRTSKMSTISISGSLFSQKSTAASLQEQQTRSKISRLENIEETDF